MLLASKPPPPPPCLLRLRERREQTVERTLYMLRAPLGPTRAIRTRGRGLVTGSVGDRSEFVSLRRRHPLYSCSRATYRALLGGVARRGALFLSCARATYRAGFGGVARRAGAALARTSGRGDDSCMAGDQISFGGLYKGESPQIGFSGQTRDLLSASTQQLPLQGFPRLLNKLNVSPRDTQTSVCVT